jgi:SAM-dependent methyltransferase
VSEPARKAANSAHWDEKVAVHLGPRGYDLTSLRAGRGRFNAIEEAELWPVDGRRVLHLQCHFGADSLKLAQRGATVVGVDFSAPAIDAACNLANELGLTDRATFVEADFYDAPVAIPKAAAFDMVYVTWGAIIWLPDIYRWAEIVCHVLKPGGSLYLAEAHPVAMVFDDEARLPDGRPGLPPPSRWASRPRNWRAHWVEADSPGIRAAAAPAAHRPSGFRALLQARIVSRLRFPNGRDRPINAAAALSAPIAAHTANDNEPSRHRSNGYPFGKSRGNRASRRVSGALRRSRGPWGQIRPTGWGSSPAGRKGHAGACRP